MTHNYPTTASSPSHPTPPSARPPLTPHPRRSLLHSGSARSRGPGCSSASAAAVAAPAPAALHRGTPHPPDPPSPPRHSSAPPAGGTPDYAPAGAGRRGSALGSASVLRRRARVGRGRVGVRSRRRPRRRGLLEPPRRAGGRAGSPLRRGSIGPPRMGVQMAALDAAASRSMHLLGEAVGCAHTAPARLKKPCPPVCYGMCSGGVEVKEMLPLCVDGDAKESKEGGALHLRAKQAPARSGLTRHRVIARKLRASTDLSMLLARCCCCCSLYSPQ